MNEVERYLKKATRGVWGRKRQEVREELEAHISERVMAYRIAGLSEEDAAERVLGELGHPREVSGGMTRIYTVPWLAGSGLMAAAVCALTVTAASMGMAQTLQTAPTFPSPLCLESGNTDTSWNCSAAGAWATFEELKDVLEPQGVELTQKRGKLSLRFSNDELATVATTSLASTLIDENDKALPEEYQAQSNYFAVGDFLRELTNGSSLPVRIEGWSDLTVYIGDASFTLSGAQGQAESLYYDSLLSIAFNPNQLLANSYLKNPTVGRVEGADTLALRIEDAKPNAIYGIFTPTAIAEPESDLSLAADVAQIRADGTVNLHLSTGQPLTFIDGFTGQPQQNTAVLVRLTGTSKSGVGFGYEVVSPEQISVVN